MLRELFLLRDARAREMDRPALQGARQPHAARDRRAQAGDKLADLSEIKGVTDLMMRRFGRDVMAAVRDGRKTEHGPIPKLAPTGRRRMDRQHRATAGRAQALAHPARGEELALDPGVLCPNSALEAIAWRDPENGRDLEGPARAEGLVRPGVRRRGGCGQPRGRAGEVARAARARKRRLETKRPPGRTFQPEGHSDLDFEGASRRRGAVLGESAFGSRGSSGAELGQTCAPASIRLVRTRSKTTLL